MPLIVFFFVTRMHIMAPFKRMLPPLGSALATLAGEKDVKILTSVITFSYNAQAKAGECMTIHSLLKGSSLA